MPAIGVIWNPLDLDITMVRSDVKLKHLREPKICQRVPKRGTKEPKLKTIAQILKVIGILKSFRPENSHRRLSFYS